MKGQIISGGCHYCGNNVESENGIDGVCVGCGAEYRLLLCYDDDLLTLTPKLSIRVTADTQEETK